MLGGRAAEELVFNEMTSGASNDIEQATRYESQHKVFVQWWMRMVEIVFTFLLIVLS
jgi:ATP-dependent Zn protease